MEVKYNPADTPLARMYRWEKERSNDVYMVQPTGNGAVREYTWGETVDQVRRMAAWLQSLGFEKGDRIAMLSKNCAEFMISDLAIWMAGYVSVALYPTLNAETVQYILEHSESKLLLVGKLDTWEEMEPGVPDGVKRVAFSLAPQNDYEKLADIIANTEPMQGEPIPDEKDYAIIVYTSGSTGQPKGVVHDFHNIATASVSLMSLLNATPADRVISYLPLAHVFERAGIGIGSIFVGLKLYFADSLDTFVEDLQRARPTIFQSVPRLWQKFQQGVFTKMPEQKLARLTKIPLLGGVIKKKVLAGLGLDQCRMAISGSAPIPPELIHWYRSLGLELLEGYGMSENFIVSHFSRPGRSRVGYVGEPDLGVECRISEQGEILVKSVANMVCYYKQEEATKESFTEDGFLKTGDRGEIDDMQRLRITGRVKELFKTSKGKYIAPAPIENLVGANGLIESCCVSGSGHPQPYCLVMLGEDVRDKISDASVRSNVEAELSTLLTEVNKKVEHHEQLAFLVVVKEEWQIENGFLTPTMKIKRNIVEDHYAEQVEGWYESRQKIIWE